MQTQPSKDSDFLSLPKRSEFNALAEDSSQFLWAISYSDLLMVMMTFFVIFFEFSDTVTKTPLSELISELRRKGELAPAPNLVVSPKKAPTISSLGDSAASQKGVSARGSNPDRDTGLADLEAAALRAKMLIEREDGQENLLIHFPENIYGSGQYEMTSEGRSEMDRVLGLLKPFAKDISLVFIGHTDEHPILGLQNKLIDSNLVLSNLRAAFGVKYALTQGFEPRSVSAQGVAEYIRNTRSLSVKVVQRKSKK